MQKLNLCLFRSLVNSAHAAHANIVNTHITGFVLLSFTYEDIRTNTYEAYV